MRASGLDGNAAGMEAQTPEQVAGILLENISAGKQKRVDDLTAAEPTPGTREHEEWKYQLDVAKRELGQAQAQILMNQNGFWARSAEGAKLQGNPVEDGAWLVDTLRAYGVAEKDIERIREQGFYDYTSWGENEKHKHRIDFGIDGVPDEVIGQISAMPSGHTGTFPNPYSPFALAHVMTPSEKGVWNWYLANGDQDGANAYFELIRESLYYRDAKVRQVAREGVDSVLGTVESIPGKPVASVKATLGTFINWMQGKETSGYNPDYAMLRDYDYYRDDVREQLPEIVRPLFDVGMDLADMAAAYTMVGGAAGMNLILTNNDAASTIMETLENGGTVTEAMDRGVMTMAIQFASQSVKLGTRAGNAFLSPDEFKGAASDFLRGAFGDVMENMPAEVYQKAQERYDDLFVDYYYEIRSGLGDNPTEDELQKAALSAAESARLKALRFGLQDAFSTIVTGRLAPD